MTEHGAPGLDEILDAVTAGSRVLVGIAARSLDRSGVDITLSQCRALVTLHQLGPLSLVGLADALGVNPSTATRMCDRLVAKDLVDRRRADGGVSLRPTSAGREVVRTVTRVRRAELRRIVSQLSDDDQRELVRCMDAFRTAAGELGEGEWALGWWE
jgi:DNA-binding MarR family transcriptional regulator